MNPCCTLAMVIRFYNYYLLIFYGNQNWSNRKKLNVCIFQSVMSLLKVRLPLKYELLTLAVWKNKVRVAQWVPGTYIMSYCWLQNFQYFLILFHSRELQLRAVVIISCVWKRDESIHGWKQVGFNLLLSHPVHCTDHFPKKQDLSSFLSWQN